VKHFSIQAILSGCSPKAPFNQLALLDNSAAFGEFAVATLRRGGMAAPHVLAVPLEAGQGLRFTAQSNVLDFRAETWASDEKRVELNLTLREPQGPDMANSRKAMLRLIEQLNPTSLKAGEEHRKNGMSAPSFVWCALSTSSHHYRSGGNMQAGGTIVSGLTAHRTRLPTSGADHSIALDLHARF